MERTILHVDLNNFYASVECLYRPELQGKPVAVSGDVENRHGIILAQNLTGYWWYRIGKYRILCELANEVVTVYVFKVEHRRFTYLSSFS